MTSGLRVLHSCIATRARERPTRHIAQSRLARLYYDGDGVRQSYEEAAKWFLAAAAQGLAPAQLSIAAMYLRGEGVEKDTAKGMYWLEQAAENDHPRAQTKLGIAYYRGQGVRKNKVMAHMWLSLSADAEAVRVLEEMEPTLSIVQLRDSQRRQQKWLRKC